MNIPPNFMPNDAATAQFTPEQLALILKAMPAASQAAAPGIAMTQAPTGNSAPQTLATGASPAIMEQKVGKVDTMPVAQAGGGGGDGMPNMPATAEGRDAYNAWLLQSGQSKAPIGSTLEGIGRLAQLGSGYYGMHQTDKDAATRQASLAGVVSGVTQPVHQDVPRSAPHQLSGNAPASVPGDTIASKISNFMGWR
jgi:hypothetical protein